MPLHVAVANAIVLWLALALLDARFFWWPLIPLIICIGYQGEFKAIAFLVDGVADLVGWLAQVELGNSRVAWIKRSQRILSGVVGVLLLVGVGAVAPVMWPVLSVTLFGGFALLLVVGLALAIFVPEERLRSWAE